MGDRAWALWLGLMLIGFGLGVSGGETARWFGGYMLGFGTAGLMFFGRL